MTTAPRARDDAAVAAAQAGDEAAFARLVERHRRELRAYCYRMVGSVEEAEDLVQETFLRAWRHIGGFEGRSTLRAWLYRIATNACLDALERRPPRVLPQDLEPATTDLGQGPVEMVARTDIPWLQPLPDRGRSPSGCCGSRAGASPRSSPSTTLRCSRCSACRRRFPGRGERFRAGPPSQQGTDP